MKGQRTTINLYENTDQILNASIDKIIVELIDMNRDKANAHMVVLTGCSPLAGTTSTSISLAIAMANTGRKTALVDCDVRKAEDYKKLNDDLKKGLANYISGENPSILVDDVIYDTNIDNLNYIPCGETNGNPTRILCSEKMDDLLGNLKERFDFVFFDFPSFNVAPDSQIMFTKVDGVIFVAALGETKRSQMKDARRISNILGEKYYGLILNKVPKDIFKANVKGYDYYLIGKNGKQKFDSNGAYAKKRKQMKGKENEKK